MRYNKKIPRTTVKVLNVTVADKARLNFDDDSILREKKIVGIAVVQQNAADTVYSNDGNKIVSPAALNASMITLKNANDRTIIDRMPLSFLAIDANDRTFFELDCQDPLAPSKCFIEYNGPTGGTVQVASRDYEVHFLYED